MTYNQAIEKLGNREQKKIANNTYLVRRNDGTVAIRLHATDILTFRPDGTVVLRTNGWRSITTKARLNEYLGWGVGITQKDYTWYWTIPGVCPTRVEVQEGDIVAPDGRVMHADGTPAL